MEHDPKPERLEAITGEVVQRVNGPFVSSGLLRLGIGEIAGDVIGQGDRLPFPALRLKPAKGQIFDGRLLCLLPVGFPGRRLSEAVFTEIDIEIGGVGALEEFNSLSPFRFKAHVVLNRYGADRIFIAHSGNLQ